MMRRLGQAVVALAMAGCGVTAIDTAKFVANDGFFAGLAASEVIARECVGEYEIARTTKRIDELDLVCLPLRDAYFSTRRAHTVLLEAIEAAEATGDPDAVIAPAQDLAFATQRLVRIINGMPTTERSR